MRKFTWLATVLTLVVVTYSVIDTVMVVSPEIRSALNQKQRTITFGRGYPVGMKDGDLQVRMVPGKGPTLYAKVGGLVVEWPGKWQREVPEKKVYRELLCFGYDGPLSIQNDVVNIVAQTPGGGQNLYRMMRNGRCLGVSACYDVTDATSSGSVQFRLTTSSGEQGLYATGAVDVIGNSTNVAETGNLFNFSNDEVLGVSIRLEDLADDNVEIDDIAILVEIEVSGEKP